MVRISVSYVQNGNMNLCHNLSPLQPIFVIVKNFLYIIFLLIFVLTFSNCGKKGELEKPEKNYPKEYPSE